MVVGAKEGFKDRFIMRFLSSMAASDTTNKLGAFITAKRKLKTDTGEYLVEIIDCPEPTLKDSNNEEDIRKAHGFIFIYSLVSRASFEALSMYKGFLRRYLAYYKFEHQLIPSINRIRGDRRLVSVIVGTLPSNHTAARAVNQQEAKELATLFDAQHIELMLSARDGQAVSLLLPQCCRIFIISVYRVNQTHYK